METTEPTRDVGEYDQLASTTVAAGAAHMMVGDVGAGVAYQDDVSLPPVPSTPRSARSTSVDNVSTSSTPHVQHMHVGSPSHNASFRNSPGSGAGAGFDDDSHAAMLPELMTSLPLSPVQVPEDEESVLVPCRYVFGNYGRVSACLLLAVPLLGVTLHINVVVSHLGLTCNWLFQELWCPYALSRCVGAQ